MLVESTPPERKAPSGTSLRSRSRTAQRSGDQQHVATGGGGLVGGDQGFDIAAQGFKHGGDVKSWDVVTVGKFGEFAGIFGRVEMGEDLGNVEIEERISGSGFLRGHLWCS